MKFSKLYIILLIIVYLYSCSKILDTGNDYIFEVKTINGKPIESYNPDCSMGVIPLVIELEEYVSGEHDYKGRVKFLNIEWHRIKDRYNGSEKNRFSVNIGEELWPVTGVGFTILEVGYEREGKKPHLRMEGEFGIYGPLICGPGNTIKFTAVAKRYYEN